jgi:hypothetical protein
MQSPCQGEGRGFESRRPLSINVPVRACFLWSFRLGPCLSGLRDAGGAALSMCASSPRGERLSRWKGAWSGGLVGCQPLSVVDSLRMAVGRCLRPLSVGRRGRASPGSVFRGELCVVPPHQPPQKTDERCRSDPTATVSAFSHGGAARRAAGGDAGQSPDLWVSSAVSAVVIRPTGHHGEQKPLPPRRSPAL